MSEPGKDEVEVAAVAIAYDDYIASLCAIPQWENLSEGRRDTLRRHAASAIASRVRSDAGLTANDLHYLKSILGHLRELKSVLPDETAFTLGGEAFHDNLDWLDCFIDKHERRALAAKAAEGETADPRTTLHTVILDIRESSGLGGRPMLGELAGEIGKLRERADQVAAVTNERDDALAHASSMGERLGQCEAALTGAVQLRERAEAALAAKAAGAVGEDVREALARWSRARIALNRTKINTPECRAAFTELGSAEAALVNVALLPASPSGEGWRHDAPANARPAYWTFDQAAFGQHGLRLYYFAPTARRKPPYKTQVHVEAIIDIADDGTLAGVELVSGPLPSPPTESER